MDQVKKLSEIALMSYSHIVDSIIITLPRMLGGLLLLLSGWLLARFLAFLFKRFLRIVKFDTAFEQMGIFGIQQKISFKYSPSEIAGKFVFWTIMLLVFIGFSESLGLLVVSQKIGALLNYIPNILIAIAILVFGLFMANSVRSFINTTFESYAVKSSKLAGNIVFYILLAIISMTVLEQLQFNIGLLTSNLMILMGGVALAFAIAYGLSAREILPNIISSYYSKNMFRVGDSIRIGEAEGQIENISNTSIILRTKTGKRFIPAKKMLTEEVEVVDSKLPDGMGRNKKPRGKNGSKKSGSLH